MTGTGRRMIAAASLAAASLVGLVSQTYADSFTVSTFSTDATNSGTGISPQNTYLDTVDLNGQKDPVLVNGVTFTTGTQTGSNYTLTGAGGSYSGYTPAVSGPMGQMLSDFFYGGNETFTQAGLTPGVSYSIRFYTTSFGQPGSSRVQTLTTGSDLPIATSAGTPTYSEDAAPAQILNYTFTPINATQRDLNFTPQTSGNSEHQYAFSTQIVSTALQGLISGLHNSGVNNDESPAAGGADLHYTLVTAPGGVALGPANVDDTTSDGLQGAWLKNDSQSQWISPPTTPANGNLPGGEYIYSTTFDINGSAAGVSLTGLWTTDDTGADILVNGVSQGQSDPNGFGELTPFTLSSGFQSGLNTIDFVMENGSGSPNPTGLRVDWEDVVVATPEPASLGALALGGLGLLARRRSRPAQ